LPYQRGYRAYVEMDVLVAQNTLKLEANEALLPTDILREKIVDIEKIIAVEHGNPETVLQTYRASLPPLLKELDELNKTMEDEKKKADTEQAILRRTVQVYHIAVQPELLTKAIILLEHNNLDGRISLPDITVSDVRSYIERLNQASDYQTSIHTNIGVKVEPAEQTNRLKVSSILHSVEMLLPTKIELEPVWETVSSIVPIPVFEDVPSSSKKHHNLPINTLDLLFHEAGVDYYAWTKLSSTVERSSWLMKVYQTALAKPETVSFMRRQPNPDIRPRFIDTRQLTFKPLRA
jgi:hypothetical protein